MDRIATLESTNVAEALLELGREMQRELRKGVSQEFAFQQMQSTPRSCKLALLFAEMEPAIHFRAIVENWSMAEILHTVNGRPAPALPGIDSLTAAVGS